MLASQNNIGHFSTFIRKVATNDFTWILDFIKKYAWAMEFVVVLFITMLVSYFEHIVYQRIHPQLLKKKKHWELAVIHALHKPLACFIWLIGVTFAFDLASGYSQAVEIFRVVSPIRKVGAILIILWFLISFIKEIEKIFLMSRDGKYHLDRTTVRAVGQVLRVIVIVTSAFVILQMTLGIGASAILAFAGGGSFIIGWAAKDMLANIFGGFMIFLDRPFVIGDKICTVDKTIEGYVEHIGWRLTCIRTLEKVPVYIPNSFFSSMSIQNPSRMTHRRIYATVGLRYCDSEKLPKIVEDLTQMLKKHEELDQEEPTFVNLVNFGTASLDILIYVFTKTVDLEEFHKVRQEVFFKVLDIIHKNNAMCSFPITEGHLTVQLQRQEFM